MESTKWFHHDNNVTTLGSHVSGSKRQIEMDRFTPYGSANLLRYQKLGIKLRLERACTHVDLTEEATSTTRELEKKSVFSKLVQLPILEHLSGPTPVRVGSN